MAQKFGNHELLVQKSGNHKEFKVKAYAASKVLNSLILDPKSTIIQNMDMAVDFGKNHVT